MATFSDDFQQQPARSRVAAVMQEFGYAGSLEPTSIQSMLKGGDGRLDEQAVADALAMMAQTTPAAFPGINPAALQPDQVAAMNATLAAIANGGHSVSSGGIQPVSDGSNGGVVGWAWKVVLDVFKSYQPHLNWQRIADLLDHPAFLLHSQEGFYMLAHAYRYGAGEQLPVRAVVGRKWNNEKGQLSLLKYAVLAPPEVFSFAASERKVPPVEGLQGGKSPVGTANQAWLSVDLLQIMCHFTVDAAKRPTVLAMLEHPIKFCPEVLLLAMAAVPEDTPILQREVYSILLPPYLRDKHPNAQLVLERLWKVNPKLVKEMLLEYYLHDKEHLPRIHGICQELKVMGEVLADTPSCRFALHLAVYASQVKQTVNLSQWASARLSREPVTMVYEILLFLYAKTIAASDPSQQSQILGRLTDDTVHALVRLLLPLRPQLVGDFSEGYNATAELLAQVYPSVKPLVQSPAFSADVEAEVKANLQRLHARTATWEDIFNHIQRLRQTGGPRDRDMEAFMVHHIFNALPNDLYDEYKDLQSVSALVSALMGQHVLPPLELGMALRLILFALRQSPGVRAFAFGMAVLRNLAPRLPRTAAPFCEQVLLTAQVREADPELFSQVEAAYREFQLAQINGEPIQPVLAMLPAINLPLEAGQANVGPMSVLSPTKQAAPGPATRAPPPGMEAAVAGGAAASSAAPGAWSQQVGAGVGQNQAMQGVPSLENRSVEGNDIEGELESNLLAANQAPAQPKGMLNVNTVSLENATEKHEEPSERIRDDVHFIVNNLSADNVEQRASDIKAKVVPDYRGWFCEYMAKRAAQEHNYQQLYLRMLDKMNDPLLMKQLIKSTYFYVRLLLTGDRAVRESNDRQLLKNLGHWLGNLTLKKNKPLLCKELELKGIVTDAYQRGKLVSVLPFIANLLSVCEKSLIFTPNNPMISGLLSLLAELHKLPHLRFNAQYCIEMIFKTFGNPSVEPTNHLANLPRDTASTQDFGPVVEEAMDRGLSAETTSHMQAMMSAAAVKAFNQNIVGQRTPTKQAVMGNGNAGVPGAPPGIAPGMPGAPPGMQAAAGAAGQQGNIMSSVLGGDAGKGPADAMGNLRGAAPPTPPGAGAAAGAGPAQPGAAPVPQPSGLSIEHNAMIQYISGLAHINPSLGAIAERLQLKRHVPTAIERAIWEILNPVVDRSVTIACSTTVELLAKDFALDGDEIRMRKAAHLMVSSLAGSLALVTCKEPLRTAMTNQLSHLIASQGVVGIEKTMLEQVVTVVVQDNLENCCQVFERAATDKAVRDVDKQLQDKYDERVNARKVGRPFQGDASAFHGRFPAQLPESLRPRPGAVSAMQLRVYEDFARIPRAPPAAPVAPMREWRPYGGGEDAGGLPGKDAAGGAPAGVSGAPAGMPGFAANAMLEGQYLTWQSMADAALIKREAGGEQTELQVLMQELLDYSGATAPDDTVQFFIARIFRHMFELSTGPSKLAANFYSVALRNLAEALGARGHGPVNLTALWASADDERKFSREAVEALLHAGLLNAMEVDNALARAVMGRSGAAADTVAHLINTVVLKDKLLSYTDLATCIDALSKMAEQIRANGTPAQVQAATEHLQLADQARRTARSTLQSQRAPQEIPAVVRDTSDMGINKDQVFKLFDEWVRLCNTSGGFIAYAVNPAAGAPAVADADRAALNAYLNALRGSGLLKDEPTTERWIRSVMDLVLNHVQTVAEQNRGSEGPQVYLALDALTRLFTCITVHGSGLPFLRAVLSIFVGVVKRDADDRTAAFNGRPYLRFIVGLASELPGGNAANSNSPESLEPTALRYLRAVAEALHALQPLSVPGWAFCWLTAIAHRSVMPRLLLSPTHHGWTVYEHLLVDLLRFLDPYLRASSELTECVRALYKGTLRLLLVLLHDFPEFLCEHYFPLCNTIPVSCVQLRNLVLSAFPRNMRLPDPFTPGLKVDLLPEILVPPRVLPEPEHLLDQHEHLKGPIDAFLQTRNPQSLPAELARHFKLPQPPADGRSSYNTPLINAVVLYVGAQSRASNTAIADGPAMDIFLRLMETLDSEGRYLVLNAAANQLRFPNSHTHYFSCMLLTLFAEVKDEKVKEQITRVLLERLVVNRPHPWGLLITFIELIKNERYNFWTHEFTRNGNDVERLFKNVAHSCMAHNAAQQPPPGGAGLVDVKDADQGMPRA